MAVCDLGYDHSEPASDPEPAPAAVVVEPGPNENDVAIAEIEAAASIERERIWTEQQALALEADREELRGELRGMREVLDRLAPPAPDPAPAPAAVPVPAAVREPEAVDAPPETAPARAKKSGGGFWDGYSAD